jgi:hypothetical protein
MEKRGEDRSISPLFGLVFVPVTGVCQNLAEKVAENKIKMIRYPLCYI